MKHQLRNKLESWYSTALVKKNKNRIWVYPSLISFIYSSSESKRRNLNSGWVELDVLDGADDAAAEVETTTFEDAAEVGTAKEDATEEAAEDEAACADDWDGISELPKTSKLAVLFRLSAWTLPVAGAYHQRVVTPTGNV